MRLLMSIGLFMGCIPSPTLGFTPLPSSKCNADPGLYGLSNVNDYFSSFENNNNDNGKMKRNEPGQGSAYVQTNDYFASFTKSKTDDDTASKKWHGNDNFGINNYGSFDDGQEKQEEEKFIPQSHQPQHMSMSKIEEYNNARLCPKMLLTQVSIQSFCHLMEECRDPHSGKWLEDFLEVRGLKNYHGNGAFNITRYPTWDALLLDVIRQPNQKIIVSAKRRGRGHGGWSKNNPYLRERWVEYPIDIHPAYLIQRLLPVRQQLANEFQRDLDIIRNVDEKLMDSYFNRMRSEILDDSSNQPTFERVAVHILSNYTEFQEQAPSPLRRGNFDLLYSLCTHKAAHDLLRQLKDESLNDELTYEWFKDFYSKYVSEYFDGDQAYGRADDFMDELLKTQPFFVEPPDGSTDGLINPLVLAERLIGIRSEIVEEWKELMAEVKEEHIWLQDSLIRIMMGKNFEMDTEKTVEIKEEEAWKISDDIGAFE